MAITGSEKAYTYARGGLARGGATRGNYVPPFIMVEVVHYPPTGDPIRLDVTTYVRLNSLRITQALNDEPDRCSFTLTPHLPLAAYPTVGDDVRISWAAAGGFPAAGTIEFHGSILVVQHERRHEHRAPWLFVQCQDTMWKFDARFVTYQFPSQPARDMINMLVTLFVNDAGGLAPQTFNLDWVQLITPPLPALDVVNQRPSTVLRNIMTQVGGAFYVDGFDVHAWTGDAEPYMSHPTALTNSLASLKSFRHTVDGSQVRKRVLVEGQRTSLSFATPGWSTAGDLSTNPHGIPVADGRPFRPAPDLTYVRIGSQWCTTVSPVVVAPYGENAPGTYTSRAFAVGDAALWCAAIVRTPAYVPPVPGWVKVGDQYAAYNAFSGSTAAEFWLGMIWPGEPVRLGFFANPIPVGEAVTFVDAVRNIAAATWGTYPAVDEHPQRVLRAQSTDAPVVMMAVAQKEAADIPHPWPALEALIQDGRYSPAGALARAQAELAAFENPVISAEWDTEDYNARPGRRQVIAFTAGAGVEAPALTATLTVLNVEVTFPQRTLPPRRSCRAGVTKPSNLLDVLVTN